jgi:hypothetical protein
MLSFINDSSAQRLQSNECFYPTFSAIESSSEVTITFEKALEVLQLIICYFTEFKSIKSLYKIHFNILKFYN